MAESTTVSLPNIESFKKNALYWANQFNVVCLLDSNSYPQKNYPGKNWILAIDTADEVICGPNAFDALKYFISETDTTVFGFFSYDLKNQIEKLSSKNYDGIKFPDLYFFRPRYVFEINEDKLTVNRNYPETFHLMELIQKIEKQESTADKKMKLKASTARITYLKNAETVKKKIEEGDFYELNYCNEFYSENIEINPVETFLRLNEKAKAPFSCYFKLKDTFLLCASPERFLKKEGSKLIAQPIKGTRRKGGTSEENEQVKSELRQDPKEKAENVMIVDLMRNDLAKSSKAGSVIVKELFGIYEFSTMNQMISTVTSEAANEINCVDIIKSAFPMGSMTGTPKVAVMENIEKYEEVKRGLFSGSVGYITPDGDFDFNVVIRSILYNAADKYVSIRAGGAITYDSVAEEEYEEILLKIKCMLEALNAKVELE